MLDARTDAELLSALRTGDTRAYEALWHRHAQAAQRYARRLLPDRAEDLVSEAFLAIYQQVTTTDAGPQFAFRSYLKAVLRNTAIRWRRDADQYDGGFDIEPVDERDALSIAEQDGEATDVLAALQELPERWQRVLWLTEVVDAGRPQIAQELQIRPNAVSALHRRARAGLRLQWLTRQIPLELREDPSHAAYLFPKYLAEVGDAAVADEVNRHIADCDECADLLFDLRGSASRLQRNTLAVLLGSAGVGTASATLSSGTTAAALAVAAGGGALAWMIGGGVAAVTAGGLIVSSLFTVGPAGALPVGPAPAPSTSSAPAPSSTPERDAGVDVAAPAPTSAAPDAVDRRTGRGVTDPTIGDAGLSNDPGTQVLLPAPNPPTPAGPDVPGPATGSTPDPGSSPGPGQPAAPSPGVTSPASSAGYLSPVIAGKATSGDSVAVQLAGKRYTPAVAADGTWTFDTRGLQLAAGDYSYQAWAYSATAQSPATDGSFTVLPLEVHGFEGLSGFQDMTVAEAQATGLVITIQGPANGRVYLSSMEGHTAMVTLDASGFTRKRLVMNSRGWYYFTIRAIDPDGFWGPGLEDRVDVYDPDVIFDPWGPSQDEMTFDLVDP